LIEKLNAILDSVWPEIEDFLDFHLSQNASTVDARRVGDEDGSVEKRLVAASHFHAHVELSVLNQWIRHETCLWPENSANQIWTIERDLSDSLFNLRMTIEKLKIVCQLLCSESDIPIVDQFTSVVIARWHSVEPIFDQ